MIYTAIVKKEKNYYLAYLPDIPGCDAKGTTEKEALALLVDNVMVLFNKESKKLLPSPKVKAYDIEVIDDIEENPIDPDDVLTDEEVELVSDSIRKIKAGDYSDFVSGEESERAHGYKRKHK